MLGLGNVEELIARLVSDGVKKDKEPYEDVCKRVQEDDGDSVDNNDDDNDETNENDNDDSFDDVNDCSVGVW